MKYDIGVSTEERLAQLRATFKNSRKHHRQYTILEAAVSRLDLDQVERVRLKWLDRSREGHQIDYIKYADTLYWLWDKSARIEWIDLDRSEPLSVFDLGSGPGHFAFLCEVFGHTAVGTDLESELFRDLNAMFNVDYRVAAVSIGSPAPDFNRNYDLVSALWLKFDETYVGNDVPQAVRYWGGDEWRSFFEALRPALSPGARIFLELNPHHQPNDLPLDFDHVFMKSCLDNGARRVTGQQNRFIFDNADVLRFIPDPSHVSPVGHITSA